MVLAQETRSGMTPDEWLTRNWPLEGEQGPVLASTGGIVGSVVDCAGRPVPATVRVRGSAGSGAKQCAPLGIPSEATAGWFQLCDLAAGEYVLTIEAPGFRPERLPAVRIEPYSITAVGTIRLTSMVEVASLRARIGSLLSHSLQAARRASHRATACLTRKGGAPASAAANPDRVCYLTVSSVTRGCRQRRLSRTPTRPTAACEAWTA